MAQTPYAELHCHSNFSFLDGASAPDDLVERAVELGLTGLAVTDHAGLYGAVRFVTAAEAVGLHPIVGLEIELLDPAVADPDGIVVPARRARRRGSAGPKGRVVPRSTRRLPVRPATTRCPTPPKACPPAPGHRTPDCPVIAARSRRTCAGSSSGSAARTSSCSPARRSAGGACAGSSRTPTWPGPRRSRGSARRSWPSTPTGSSRCRAAATASWPVACGRATGPGRGPSRSATRRSSGEATVRPRAASSSSCRTTSSPTTTGSCRESAALAEALGLPVVVTNDVHYARPEDRELADVLAAIRHGRTLDTLGDLRRADGESYLKSGAELAGLGAATRHRRRGEPGRRGCRPQWSSPRRARSISASSSTASPVSRCRAGRPRSRTCRSCAGRAPGSATTR